MQVQVPALAKAVAALAPQAAAAVAPVRLQRLRPWAPSAKAAVADRQGEEWMIVYDHLEGFLPHAADAAGMAAAATVTAKFEIAGAHTPALAHRLAARPAAARQLIRHLVRVVTVARMAATVRECAAVTVAPGAALVARQPRKQIRLFLRAFPLQTSHAADALASRGCTASGSIAALTAHPDIVGAAGHGQLLRGS